MRTLRRLWDWLLPGLIYLDPMVASAFGEALVENHASHSGVRRSALVSDPRIQRRAAVHLMLASSRSSDVSPDSGKTWL